MSSQTSLDLFEHGDSRRKTMALVRSIKETGDDFEWYPTTTEILRAVKADIDEFRNKNHLDGGLSVLDVGAGDGRSLEYLTSGKRYAIELSKPLVQAMDRSIYVIGADFHQQQFLDKSVDVIFCNPPYSEYSAWASKLIREARSAFIYLVLPSRWKDNAAINDAVKLRDGETSVIGSFDFSNADRQARAKVDIVKVCLARHYSRFGSLGSSTDPFNLWFDENFKIETPIQDADRHEAKQGPSNDEVKRGLVAGSDIVTILVNLYDLDLQKLIDNYKSFEQLDPELLRELGVDFKGVREGLRMKVKGLKYAYWIELFNNMTSITSKLTTAKRKDMLDKLTSHTDVDFNAKNVYAVCIWIVKNANYYYDDQLVNFVERMVEEANVELYKSNEKTFGREGWRYYNQPEGLDRYQLEYRIVLNRVGGLVTSEWDHEIRQFNGLAERAFSLLQDMQTIATNLGYDCAGEVSPSQMERWESNKAQEFKCHHLGTGETLTLASVKAFKNGNLHIKFQPAFMQKLNIEFGRLKGWLKSAQEASAELDIPLDVAEASFNSNLSLDCTKPDILRLVSPGVAE